MAQTPMTSGYPEMAPTDTESAVSLTLEEGEEERWRSPSVGSQELDLGVAGPLHEPLALQHINYAINSFAHRLLRYLPRQQNLSFSPSHVYWLLVSLCFGCAGSTQEQLEEVLRFSELPMPADRIPGFFKNLIRILRAGGRHQRLQFISALFVASIDSVHEGFSKTLRENFSVAIRTLQADPKPEHTRSEVNRWFEITSRGYVPSVMGDNLPRGNGAGASSCQLIASAAYAEHAWGSRFGHHKTILANFYNNGTDPCKTHMVRCISYYRYCASKALSARCLVVPSMARNWHMLLLLPTDRRGVHAVEYRLDAEAFQQAVSSCREALVELSMPNIELESSVCLSEVLKRAGLADLFDSGKVDLGGLFKEARTPLTEFVHKVKLKVNKVGHQGEHHGVTVLTEAGDFPSSPIEFHVNHPFVFVLYDPAKNATLFVGRVVELIW
ncbi:hypothetical protein V5799_010069 [Amblyomma americanum]|uniref:Serpin domain-containing protein n=1 Tax=Amblyomma americanum TaxID=6943 RepID=A0AAQ4FA80_AMBAM